MKSRFTNYSNGKYDKIYNFNSSAGKLLDRDWFNKKWTDIYNFERDWFDKKWIHRYKFGRK